MNITRLELEGICRYCGALVANGVGGEGDLLTPILHTLPSSHLFHRSGNCHDVLYHQRQLKREAADRIFLELMLEEARRFGFIKRSWYTAQAYRNFYAVRIFGEKFFKNGCCSKIDPKF